MPTLYAMPKVTFHVVNEYDTSVTYSSCGGCCKHVKS